MSCHDISNKVTPQADLPFCMGTSTPGDKSVLRRIVNRTQMKRQRELVWMLTERLERPAESRLNEKTALAEIAESERAPRDFAPREQKTLAGLGESESSLQVAVKSVAELLRGSAVLAGESYRSRYELLSSE